VAAATDRRAGWAGGSATNVDPAHAVRGFHAVELRQRVAGRTAALMIEALGFREAAPRVPGRVRLESGSGGPGTFVDLVEDAEAPAGRMGAGAVHHVAWRVPDDARQIELRTLLLERGLSVSDVRDRQYFHSIYFHEPGGALFEAATDGPGFAVDEDPAALGRVLKLPPWLEARRAAIEAGLAPVHFHA
jgi:glyoxalase family protein